MAVTPSSRLRDQLLESAERFRKVRESTQRQQRIRSGGEPDPISPAGIVEDRPGFRGNPTQR